MLALGFHKWPFLRLGMFPSFSSLLSIFIIKLLDFFQYFLCIYWDNQAILFLILLIRYTGLPWWLRWQRICLQCGRPGCDPWVGRIPWQRKRLPTPVFFPGEFHGQRSLAVYSPWYHKQLDTTKHLSHTHSINWMSVLTLKSLLVWVLSESRSFCSSLGHHSIPRFYYSASHTVVPQ